MLKCSKVAAFFWSLAKYRLKEVCINAQKCINKLEFTEHSCKSPACRTSISPYRLISCRFCKAHDFEKPNDKRGLDLMDACAVVCLMPKSSQIL